MKTVIRLLVLGAMILGLNSASAISFTELGIGQYDINGSVSPSTEVTYVSYLINQNNYLALGGTAPTMPAGPTFTVALGSSISIPPALPGLSTGTKTEVNDVDSISFGAGYAYLVAKAGNTTYAIYLAGISGSFAKPARNGISHYTLYKGENISVPDGGTTVAMLGLALLGLGALRFKK